MNDLFVCDSCNHIDAFEFAYPQPRDIPVGPHQCTQCQTGSWHGLFSYRPYDPTTDLVVNRETGIGLS